MPRILARLALAVVLAFTIVRVAPAQRGGPMTDSAKAQRWTLENELQSLAVVERKVMIPMRDGIRIPADIYRPKDTSKRVSVHLGAHAVQLQLLGRARTACRAT